MSFYVLLFKDMKKEFGGNEEDIKESDNSRKFDQLNKTWSHKQVAYWQNTTRRFFVIENFMKSKKMYIYSYIY